MPTQTRSRRTLRPYLVESDLGRWFVINAYTARSARSSGVREWGRGYVDTVRRATPQEVANYERQKGAVGTYEGSE